MTIVQYGSVNVSALVTPEVLVQIIPPAVANLNGQPTNVIAFVGTASGGPVGVPTVCSSAASYQSIYGAVQNRTYDMGTWVSAAVLQGATNFVCVRVTDGTDAKATYVFTAPTDTGPGITATAINSGSLYNKVVVSFSQAAKANCINVTVGIPGQTVETFSNITASTGAAFWAALAPAINTGIGQNGASKIITAVAGSGTKLPTLPSSFTLASGTDGASAITSALLVGNSATLTGIYATANQNVSILAVCDLTDSTQWSTVDAFAQSNQMYNIVAGPSGDTITNAATTVISSGVDSYSTKIMFGDYLYYSDVANGLSRYVSPAPFVAGLLANLSPNNSTLNKRVYGFGQTQKSVSGNYSQAQLQALELARIDVIANPSPGGQPYFAVQGGINSSSNSTINGDNYTRLTNYLATTFGGGIGMGQYIGQPGGPALEAEVISTLTNLCQNMLSAGLLSVTSTGAVPWTIVCNSTNNTSSALALGYMTATVDIQYAPILRFLITNLQGGQSVVLPVSGSSSNSNTNDDTV